VIYRRQLDLRRAAPCVSTTRREQRSQRVAADL